jgi:predicted transcriptional regulator
MEYFCPKDKEHNMNEEKKSFIREIIDVLEPAGFEVVGMEGAAYDVVCDWAKITVRRVPPGLLEDTTDIRQEPKRLSTYR